MNKKHERRAVPELGRQPRADVGQNGLTGLYTAMHIQTKNA